MHLPGSHWLMANTSSHTKTRLASRSLKRSVSASTLRLKRLPKAAGLFSSRGIWCYYLKACVPKAVIVTKNGVIQSGATKSGDTNNLPAVLHGARDTVKAFPAISLP